MNEPSPISYAIGLKADQYTRASRLYDEAFGQKFRVAVPSREQRLALFEGTFVGEFAITASAGEDLVGLAGFHTSEGSLTGGIGLRQLFSSLGLIRGLRAAVVFSLFERTPKPGELLMDGIAVDHEYRGHGIGSQLLKRIVSYATDHGYQTVRLDVIDTNPGARRLYERFGFVAVSRETFPYLRWLLGFGGATTMQYEVSGTP